MQTKLIVNNVVLPLLRRVGTAMGAYLVARGVDADAAAQIVTGAVALGGVAIDLIASSLNRKEK